MCVREREARSRISVPKNAQITSSATIFKKISSSVDRLGHCACPKILLERGKNEVRTRTDV